MCFGLPCRGKRRQPAFQTHIRGGIFPLAPRPRVSQVFLLPSRVKVVQLCRIVQRRRSLNFSSTSSSSSSPTSSFSYFSSSSSSSSLLLHEARSCLDCADSRVSNTCERVKALSDHRVTLCLTLASTISSPSSSLVFFLLFASSSPPPTHLHASGLLARLLFFFFYSSNFSPSCM